MLVYYENILGSGFYDEYMQSPVFHDTVQRAADFTLMMSLAKLYDTSTKGAGTISIRYLLTKCGKCHDMFPEKRVYKDGTYSSWQYSVQRYEYDMMLALFPGQKDMLEMKKGVFNGVWPIHIGMTVSDILKVFDYKLKQYDSVIIHLKERRNKIYAHNDGEQRFDIDQIRKDTDILWSDITRLLDLAYDVCNFVLDLLDNRCVPRHFEQGDDIAQMFEQIRCGRKYHAEHALAKDAEFCKQFGAKPDLTSDFYRQMQSIIQLPEDKIVLDKPPKFHEGSYTDSLIHGIKQEDTNHEAN